MSTDSPFAYRIIQARNFKRRFDARTVDLVVMHDEEAVESDKTARNVAMWFAGPNAPQASSHYTVDRAEIVQCVPESDDAWHAPPVNDRSIGIEMSGFAKQSEAEWLADAAMLDNAASLVADCCARNNVPPTFLDAAALLRGERGITTHAEISRAWHKSNHSDPGEHFPMAHFLEMVRGRMTWPDVPNEPAAQ